MTPSPFAGVRIATDFGGAGLEFSLDHTRSRMDDVYESAGETQSNTTITTPVTVAALRLILTRPIGSRGSVVFGFGGVLTVIEPPPLPNFFSGGYRSDDRDHLGLTVSAGLRVPAFLGSGSRIEIGVVNNFYHRYDDFRSFGWDVSRPAGRQGERYRRLQHDLMISAGLGIAMGS